MATRSRDVLSEFSFKLNEVNKFWTERKTLVELAVFCRIPLVTTLFRLIRSQVNSYRMTLSEQWRRHWSFIVSTHTAKKKQTYSFYTWKTDSNPQLSRRLVSQFDWKHSAFSVHHMWSLSIDVAFATVNADQTMIFVASYLFPWPTVNALKLCTWFVLRIVKPTLNCLQLNHISLLRQQSESKFVAYTLFWMISNFC